MKKPLGSQILAALALIALPALLAGCHGNRAPVAAPGAAEANGSSNDSSGDSSNDSGGSKSTDQPGAALVPITILATNDIHGGVEPGFHKTSGSKIGGMEFFSGVVKAIRKGVAAHGGGTLVVDAGDQFQGTLISNMSEGELTFKLMDEVGYDAVVPGNHDYDFGPKGWLKDRATAPGENPREVIEGLARQVRFPLLSANTYLVPSLVDVRTGAKVEAASNSCATATGVRVDWGRAQRPAFLKPYVIREIRGVRVALIGMDNPATANMTTASNVSDLCFRDPVEQYAETARSIGDQADVFVLIIHGADSPGNFELSDWVRFILRGKKARLDAVVAGHTHMIQKSFVDGVPIIQSGSGGERFGRIDFVVDSKTRQIVSRDTQVVSGVALLHEACDAPKAVFCEKKEAGVYYDQNPVTQSDAAAKLIAAARAEIEPIAHRKLFVATENLKRSRTSESPMSNLLTDALKRTSGADIAFLNTGGIRADLPAGDVSYENFFEVLPFGNSAVVAEPMDVDRLLRLLQRSIATCGDYGALMQSGLRVKFERDCGANTGAVDLHAKLLRVETVSGDVIFDDRRGYVRKGAVFRVATLDFLLDGGSGYSDFKGIPKTQDLGIIRERLVREFLDARPGVEVTGEVDGRWQEVAPPASH